MTAFLARPGVKKVLLGKALVAMGLSAHHFLPPEYSNYVNWITNLVWLFMF